MQKWIISTHRYSHFYFQHQHCWFLFSPFAWREEVLQWHFWWCCSWVWFGMWWCWFQALGCKWSVLLLLPIFADCSSPLSSHLLGILSATGPLAESIPFCGSWPSWHRSWWCLWPSSQRPGPGIWLPCMSSCSLCACQPSSWRCCWHCIFGNTQRATSFSRDSRGPKRPRKPGQKCRSVIDMSRLLRSRCPPLLGLRTGVARVAAPLTTIWSRIMWCLLRPSYRTMLFDSDVAIGGMAGFFRRLLLSLCEKNYSESFRDIPLCFSCIVLYKPGRGSLLYIIQLNSAGRRAIRQLDSFLLVLGLLIPWEAVICIWNGLEKYSLLRDIFALGMGQSSWYLIPSPSDISW